MTLPGWCTLDHHLPYQNGLYSSAHRELFNPLPSSLHSASPLLPYKNLCLHWGVKKAFETRVLHLLKLLAPDNKSLSFTSAPVSQVLACKAAGRGTCIWLQHENSWKERAGWEGGGHHSGTHTGSCWCGPRWGYSMWGRTGESRGANITLSPTAEQADRLGGQRTS